MAFTVNESVIAFAKHVMTLAYVGCKTAVFNDPTKKVYTMHAKTTRIREIQTGGAGDYTGKYEAVGGADSVTWKDYQANVDRFKQLCLDIVDEMATYEAGMSPSIIEATKDFINRVMAGEIDAYSIASWFSQVPVENVLASSDHADKNSFEILDEISKAQLSAGVDLDKEVIVFINPDRYFAMRKEIIANNGLANGAVLSKRDRNINLGVEDMEALSISTDVIRYNNFTLIPMPADRMKSAIVLYDGLTDGQTAGGWAPDADAKDIEMLAMPIDSGFMDVKYMVLNFFVPLMAMGMNTNAQFDKIINKVLGDVVIKEAGVNQKGDNFEVDFRCIYNAELFDIKKKTVFAVVGE